METQTLPPVIDVTPITLSQDELLTQYNDLAGELGDAYFRLSLFEHEFKKKQQAHLKEIESLCLKMNQICIENQKMSTLPLKEKGSTL